MCRRDSSHVAWTKVTSHDSNSLGFHSFFFPPLVEFLVNRGQQSGELDRQGLGSPFHHINPYQFHVFGDPVYDKIWGFPES